MAFGEGPLSHPLIVEAAETLFHPVAIRNNVEGYERTILERFKEPTWNNPVMRFLGADGKDLLLRKDRQWRQEQVVQRMDAALRKSEASRPLWWGLLAGEHAPGEVEVARFAMS